MGMIDGMRSFPIGYAAGLGPRSIDKDSIFLWMNRYMREVSADVNKNVAMQKLWAATRASLSKQHAKNIFDQ